MGKVMYNLLPGQKTRRHNLSVEIDIYRYAEELQIELDHIGVMTRLKVIPQLGIIKVSRCLLKTRYDYIMLQLYLHQLIKTELQQHLKLTYNNFVREKEFCNDYKYLQKDWCPSIGDILQLLTIVYNIGHFYNTFTSSKAVVTAALENCSFYNMVLKSSDSSRYQKIARDILNSRNYQRLHLLNSILILEKCDQTKPSVSLALEILYAYLNESALAEDSKLKYVFKIFRNVRTVSYMAYPIDPLKAIQIQKNAYTRNCELFKPQCGIEYTKISYIHENRLNNIRKYLLKFNNYNELLLNINALLDDLSFGVESKKFELALKEIGLLLGYVSQCPDRENKKGPDNLWCGVNDHYLLFECKNEVSEDRKAITKQEAGQMNNHCGWFENQYGVSKKVDRFIIIPTKNLAYDGDFTHLVKVIRRQKLREFKQTIRRFIQEIKQYDFADISDEKLQSILDYNKLNVDDFSFNFSEDFYHLPPKNVTGKQV